MGARLRETTRANCTLRTTLKTLRADQRAPNQLRAVIITPNFVSTATGSALIEVGRTRVLCTASLEDTVPQFQKGSGKGWITGEYGLLPGSTEKRTPREAARGRQSGRTLEIQRMIGRSLRAIADLKGLGERTVWVDCDVLQADGGTRTAAITGAYVALALALKRMVTMGILPRTPLVDSVAATSVGIVEDTPLLDLTYAEDSRAQVDMNVVMTGSGRYVEVQATGEGRSFLADEMERLLALATRGIAELTRIQQAILASNTPKP